MKSRVIHLLVIFSFLHLSINAQTPPTSLAEFDDLATTLVTLKSQQEREQVLEKNRALVTPNLRKALIRQGNAQLLAGRYSTAFDIYGLTRDIAQQIGDREGVATAWLDLGTVYYFQANYPAALDHYKKARELFLEVANDYESAKALSGVALIYKEQRREAEALATLQQVLKEFTSLDDKLEVANTLNEIGTIYYGQGNYSAAADAFLKSSEANPNVDSVVRRADALYMQGDYLQALSYYKQSLERAPPMNIGAIVAALTGAANSAYYLGNYEEALQNYQRSVGIHKELSEKLGVANALKGIGNVYRSRGEYGPALENYFNSLALLQEIKGPLGTTLGSIGLVRALQGDYPRALEYYGKALKEFDATSNKIEMARVLSLIGNVHYSQGRYDLSLVSYRQALSLREAMDDKPGQADVLAGIGTTLLRQKNYSEALDNFHKALGLFDFVWNRKRVAEVLTHISEVFLLQEDYPKALSAAESATAIARQLDYPEILWYARTLAGKAHAKSDQAPQTFESFTTAISIVESLRSQPSVVMSKDHNSSLPYLSAIDFLIDQHRTAEAFHYAEREKVQRLIELLKTGNATSGKGVSKEERSEEQRLASEVALLELQRERQAEQRMPNETRLSELQRRSQQARASYAEFRRSLFKRNPSLKVGRGELDPPKLDELRSLITDTSTALLEYTITEHDTYLFVLTADRTAPSRPPRKPQIEINLKVYPLQIRHAELISAVKRLEQLLTSRDNNFQDAAREVYDLLLKPAADQLALKTKLLIVPDGPLWRLPFEALQPSDNYYVADQMQVSYAPSLSLLREMRRLRPTSGRVNPLLAYGNPVLSGEFSALLELAHPGIQLQPNTAQEQEIQQVKASYGPSTSRLSIGAEASEERIKSELARAKIAHFATPAILDDASPMSSFIGLSSTANAQDGFLQAREILNLQSSAELVVLSETKCTGGCDGGWPVGLSWSWFAAGTPAMMISRWTVDPSARLALLNKFYSSIKPSGRSAVSKARALHQSATSVRRTSGYDHPYYWANFALIGDAR